MRPHVVVTHRTRYRYSTPVELGPHIIRLTPTPYTRARVLGHSLSVSPKTPHLAARPDAFGNTVVHARFPEEAAHLTMEVELTLDMAPVNPFDFVLEDRAVELPVAYSAAERAALHACLEPPTGLDAPGPGCDAWLAALPADGRWTLDWLIDAGRRVARGLDYQVRLEAGVQTPEETLGLASGSCRDSAWLLVTLMRQVGLAARFVSGYLVQLRANEDDPDRPGGEGRGDFADLHAWVEVFLPGAGWVGIDTTSGLFTAEGHVSLCATPSPEDALPVSGSHSYCAETIFDFHMEVRRIRQVRDASQPHTPVQAEALQALGHAVDARLVKAGAQLTQGGRLRFLAPAGSDTAEVAAKLSRVLGEAGWPVASVEAEAGPRFHGKGTLRVDLPPSADWATLAQVADTLYDAAEALDCTPVRHFDDGRTAPAGGASCVLGGFEPENSLFLRRPDVVARLVATWQRHPSLSYLFGGLLAGACSPHPRPDETGDGSLPDLRRAIGWLTAGTAPGPQAPDPGLADALLRPLLADAEGHAQAVEWSVADLWPPVRTDSAIGRRLGRLVLRAFDTPAHPGLYQAASLLVRALVVQAAEHATHQPVPDLVAWGPRLADRAALPVALWEDFRRVLDDLNAAGLGFDAAWFRPQYEYRFPIHGRVSAPGVWLELRQALERWPLVPSGRLADDGTQARYIDSSTERVQVRAGGIGFDPASMAVLANGRRVPLEMLADGKAWTGAVRLRTWLPPVRLLPGLPADTPLTLALVDLATRRVLVAATLHTHNPRGEAPGGAPLNGRDAETRWRARFEPLGRAPAPEFVPPATAPDPWHPLTLDLTAVG